MPNLTRNPIKSGPLTLVQMNDTKKQRPPCPPCTHDANCKQGRNCPADPKRDESRMALMAVFWTVYLALVLVAVGAGISHFMPALNALFSK